ncbi:low temperature requirement protein A [Deinococcus sp.]|uniref:low temperature requirement protein A n=1 Tax=Deinococcus sp. TaxID=47478 RepID=UPI003CC583BD
MIKNFRRWWMRPALHGPDDTAKRVTWLELFYDLVFVVVISRLAHHLGLHPDVGGIVSFVLLFVPVWWVWVSGTYYNERFETFDLSFRFFVFLQMLAVAAIAATAEEGTGRTASAFALSYAAARLIVTLMWWRAGRHNPGVRPVTNVYVAGFSVSIALWAISAFLPASPLATGLRVLALLIEVAVPFLTLAAQRRVFTGTARKLPERFGLFVIIVLGENLVGVTNGLADVRAFSFVTLLRFVLGLLVGFGLWWVYFDNIGRREPAGTGGSLRLTAWVYLHLPLVMGITAIGAMLAHVIGLHGGAVEASVRWILAGGFALSYLCMAALTWTLEPEEPELIAPTLSSALRIGTALIALLLPLLGVPLTGLLAALVALHLVSMGVGVRAWFASDHAGRTDVH